MILTSKITSKGQITLPKEVRKLLNVREGNVIVFEKERGIKTIYTFDKKHFRDIEGIEVTIL